MKRNRPFRELLRRISIRLMVLMLVLYSPAPLQLVLCSESGELPRVEQALNGQCLSGNTISCGECVEVAAYTHAHSGAGSLLVEDDHGHCSSCSDELIHVNQHSLLASQFLLPPVVLPGGCLFESEFLYLIEFQSGLPAVQRAGQPVPLPTELQVSRTTCLLM